MRIEDAVKSPNQISSCEPLQTLAEDVGVSEIRLELSKRMDNLEERMKRLAPVNEEELVLRILSRLPKTQAAVYQVAPLEKIKNDFLEETKQKILVDISKLTPEHQRIIKFVEAAGKGVALADLVSRCFYLSATSGGSRQKVLNLCKDLDAMQLSRRDKNSTVYPRLKDRIKDLLQFHGATEQEAYQVYQHVMARLISWDKEYTESPTGSQERK